MFKIAQALRHYQVRICRGQMPPTGNAERAALRPSTARRVRIKVSLPSVIASKISRAKAVSGFIPTQGIFLRSLRPRRPFSGRREKLPLQSDVLGLAGVMRDGARKLRPSAEPPSFHASAAAGSSSTGCSEKCPRPGAKAPPPLPPAAARIRAGAVAPEPAFAACIRPEIADRPHPAAKRH